MSAPADDAVREMVAEETARCAAVVQGLAMDAERDGNEAVGRALRLAASKVRRTGTAHETERLVREATRAAAERAGRDAKGGEKEATQGTCSRCGYLAMPPACTKCYSPYPAPAPRDGGAKGGSEGGERG